MCGKKLFGRGRWLLQWLHRLWDELLAFFVHVLPVLIVAYICLIIVALVQSSHWPFALQAQSRIVEIKPDAKNKIQWDLSSAVLCLRKPLTGASSVYKQIEDTGRIRDYCGSANRHAYEPVSGRYAPELWGVLGGTQSKSVVSSVARISSIGNNRVTLHIEQAADTSSPSTITIEETGVKPVEVALPASFNWSTKDGHQPLVFPFSGAIRVGQDVNASRRQLLESGHISIFSPSQRDVGGRSVVESIELLPGDMVDLSGQSTPTSSDFSATTSNDQPAFARGFVRITGENMMKPRPIMQVVAFGQSNFVRVSRFGEAGLDFEPGIWSRLTHDDRVVTATLLLITLLSVLASVAETRSLIRGSFLNRKDQP